MGAEAAEADEVQDDDARPQFYPFALRPPKGSDG
jgi:phage gp45-like